MAIQTNKADYTTEENDYFPRIVRRKKDGVIAVFFTKYKNYCLHPNGTHLDVFEPLPDLLAEKRFEDYNGAIVMQNKY